MTFLNRQQNIWDRNFTLAWLCRFAFFFAFGMVEPTLALYLDRLGANPAQIGLVMAVFPVMALSGKPVFGYFMDRYGIRTYLLAALLVYAVAPLGYAVAAGIPLLVLTRLVHGVAFSGLPMASVSLVSDVIPKRHRGEGLGIFMVSSNVAQALAASLGVWLLATAGPRLMFSSVSLAGAFALVIAMLLPPDQSAGELTTKPRVTLREYASSFVSRTSLGFSLPIFAAFFLAGGVTAFLPLQAVDMGVTNPGIYFTIYAASVVLSRPTMGGISDRLGRNQVVIPSFLILTAAVAILAWAPSWYWFLVAAVMQGFAHGSLQSTLIAAMVDVVPAHQRSAALAQWGLLIELGISSGSAVLGVVLSLTGHSYLWMYITCAGVLLGGLATFLTLVPQHTTATAD